MSNIERIAARSAAEIGLAFRNGEADPAALTDHLLGRIAEAWDSDIFITMTAERARAEAEAAAERHAKSRQLSPLDGVPIAWKDLFDVAGTPTTAGSSLFRNAAAKTRDLPTVANAAAAGMVCLGKLNLTEFAYSGLGLNPHFGTPVNPNDASVRRAPGGSSSGSGAAVAAGLVPCAIGTDTGGSVRIPASLNGTYGFKTSEGRIDKTGMVPLSRTLDTIGPLARSVEDCVLIDMVLRGAVTAGARRRDLDGLIVVVPENLVFDACDKAVVENFEASVATLSAAGVRIDRRRVDVLDQVAKLTARHGSLTAAEAYHEYKSLIESERGAEIDGRVLHRIAQGGRMSAYDLLCIQQARGDAMAAIAAELGDALIAMPTTPITAPEVAPLETDVELFHKVNLLTLRNTMIGNFLGLCSLAIPNGRDANGLPTSILFSAPQGRDDDLLGFGLDIDRRLGPGFEPAWRRN